MCAFGRIVYKSVLVRVCVGTIQWQCCFLLGAHSSEEHLFWFLMSLSCVWDIFFLSNAYRSYSLRLYGRCDGVLLTYGRRNCPHKEIHTATHPDQSFRLCIALCTRIWQIALFCGIMFVYHIIIERIITSFHGIMLHLVGVPYILHALWKDIFIKDSNNYGELP